jgi:hypothetical protein
MGRARFVVSGVSTNGQYTIEIDSGESVRLALIAALSQVLDLINGRIAAQSAQIELADAREAEIEQQLDEQVQVITTLQQSGELEQASLAARLYSEFYLPKLGREKAQNQPMRTALRKMKDELKDATRKQNELLNLTCIDRRTAWCVTRTLAILNNPVRTLEIAGEPNMVLIAPETAAPVVGDGNIAQSEKDAVLATLNTRLAAKTASLTQTETKITSAEAERATLQAALDTANANFIAAPSDLTRQAVDAATEDLLNNEEKLSQLRMLKSSLDLQIKNINNEIVIWSAKTATETPIYGDGQLWSRELLSPEQVYFNAAILPGWQRDKPTYRWGTASNIDYDNNKMTVTLSATPTSSAQGLNVNKVGTLTDVPIVYLTCNAGAFADGDRVVVEFTNQSWNDPKVIGFVDNPQACAAVTVGYTLSNFPNNEEYEQTYTVYRGQVPRLIPAFEAPPVPPDEPLKYFRGWADSSSSSTIGAPDVSATLKSRTYPAWSVLSVPQPNGGGVSILASYTNIAPTASFEITRWQVVQMVPSVTDEVIGFTDAGIPIHYYQVFATTTWTSVFTRNNTTTPSTHAITPPSFTYTTGKVLCAAGQYFGPPQDVSGAAFPQHDSGMPAVPPTVTYQGNGADDVTIQYVLSFFNVPQVGVYNAVSVAPQNGL